MNFKNILAASAIAFASTGAFASEATQFTNLGGNLNRAEVKAELSRAQANGEIKSVTALYGSFDTITAGTRDRADVRAEAVMAIDNKAFSMLYGGA